MAITQATSSLAKARITSQNQISVPKAIREHLGAGPGDDLLFEARDDGSAIVRRRKRISILDMAGIAADSVARAPATAEELDELIAEGLGRQFLAKQERINRQRRRAR